MLRSKRTYFFFALSCALAAAGFLLSFWPLAAAGVVLAGLSPHPVLAVGFGIMLDLAYGAPLGGLYVLFFPMTLLALASVLARRLGRRYFFDSSLQERL
jgi:hypothetical protein